MLELIVDLWITVNGTLQEAENICYFDQQLDSIKLQKVMLQYRRDNNNNELPFVKLPCYFNFPCLIRIAFGQRTLLRVSTENTVGLDLLNLYINSHSGIYLNLSDMNFTLKYEVIFFTVGCCCLFSCSTRRLEVYKITLLGYWRCGH